MIMKKIDWHKKYLEFIKVGDDLEWEKFLDFCWKNGVTDDYDDTDFEKWVKSL